MSEFVDEHDFRLAGQDAVDVHLLELTAPVGDCAGRNDLETTELLGGVGAAVGFDHSDHDVGATLGSPMCLAEHGEGLSHAGCSAKVDAQRAARLRHGLHLPVHHIIPNGYPLPPDPSSARLSWRTLTAGSPMNPRARPVVCLLMSLRTTSTLRFLALATRGAWRSA